MVNSLTYVGYFAGRENRKPFNYDGSVFLKSFLCCRAESPGDVADNELWKKQQSKTLFCVSTFV